MIEQRPGDPTTTATEPRRARVTPPPEEGADVTIDTDADASSLAAGESAVVGTISGRQPEHLSRSGNLDR